MDVSKRGTPKTLDQAIINALDEAETSNNPEIVEALRNHVRDFMSQKFGILTLQTDEQTSAMLRGLFNNLTRKENA